MSAGTRRAERLYPGLSARERAVLVAQAAEEGREPEWQIYATMPDGQAAEFNRDMALLRGLALSVTPYAFLLAEEVAHARTRLAGLATLICWGLDRAELLGYIAFQTPEPCTPEEFAQHLAAARADALPIADAADAVIAARGLWTEDDGEDADQQERRYARLAGEVEAELRALVRQRRLPARGRGANLAINVGALSDWLEQPTPVPAEWGSGYEVLPPEGAARRQAARERVRERARTGPGSPWHILPALAPAPGWLRPDADLPDLDRLLRTGAEHLQADLIRLAGELGALAVVLDEGRETLGGHDPAPPVLRATLERLRTELAALREEACPFLGPIEPPGPDAETLQHLRELLRERRR